MQTPIFGCRNVNSFADSRTIAEFSSFYKNFFQKGERNGNVQKLQKLEDE